MRWSILVIVAILSLILSCQKNESAKETLSKFIDLRFQNNQTIESVSFYLDGAAKDLVSQMNAEEQKEFLVSDNHKKISFEIEHDNCQGNNEDCSLTYRLKYRVLDKEMTKDSSGYEIAVKKIVKMHKVANQWKIYDISNVKTNIDAEKPLTP